MKRKKPTLCIFGTDKIRGFPDQQIANKRYWGELVPNNNNNNLWIEISRPEQMSCTLCMFLGPNFQLWFGVHYSTFSSTVFLQLVLSKEALKLISWQFLPLFTQ